VKGIADGAKAISYEVKEIGGDEGTEICCHMLRNFFHRR
jgi:hypothetical protein